MKAAAEAYRVDLSAFEDSQRKRIFEGDLRGLFDAWAKAVGWNYLGEDEAADFLFFAPDPHSWAEGMRKDISSLYAGHMGDTRNGAIPGREAVTIHRWAIAVWDALKVADPYILPTEPTATAAPTQEPAAPTQEPAAPEEPAAPTKATPWQVLVRDSYGPFAEQIITAFEIAVKRGIATESDDKTRLFWQGPTKILLVYFCALSAGGEPKDKDEGKDKDKGKDKKKEYLLTTEDRFKWAPFERIWGVQEMGVKAGRLRSSGDKKLPVKGREKIEEIVNSAEKILKQKRKRDREAPVQSII